MEKSTGLTLIELLVVMVLIAVLGTIAVPAYFSMTANNRITGAVNALAATLSYARSEAVIRGEQVVVCPSANGTACDNGGWQEGWIVFVDKDNNNAYDSSSDGNPIRVHGAIGSDVTMASSPSSGGGAVAPYIGFNRMGFAQPTFSGTVTTLNVVTCPPDKRTANARAVVIVPSGDVTTAARDQSSGSAFTCL
ncbi:MAG: GspH/FimT family pseudopilin [Gammaproteobacteria bacterium]